MATVAEMIEYFNTLPQEAIVECGEKTFGGGFFLTAVDIKSTKILDCREEDPERFPQMAGKIFIQLHGE